MNIPNTLGKYGREFYTELAEEFEIADVGGLSILCIAAECLDRLREAQERLDTDGTIIEDRFGTLRPHPSVAIEQSSRTAFLCSGLPAGNRELGDVGKL